MNNQQQILNEIDKYLNFMLESIDEAIGTSKCIASSKELRQMFQVYTNDIKKIITEEN